MRDDLVKRLRQYSEVKLPNEAASRIEKLEAALREIANGPICCPVSNAMRDIARKALDAK